MSRNDLVEITVDNVKAMTSRAALCVINGEEIWLPLSQCWDGGAENWSPSVGDAEVLVDIPQWLAEEKGLT